MKIAVTGALGHIGSSLIRKLPEIVHCEEILLLDDFSCQRYSSVFNLPKGLTKYRFVEADVTKSDLAKLFDGYDAVVHLAAITNAAGSFEMRQQVEKVNFGATHNVAKACNAVGAKLIALSSTSVYGTQNDWVDENCTEEELKPQSPYAETKLREEKLLQDMRRENPGFGFVTFRFGTIFGTSPGMRFHTAVNKFCWQAVVGEPLTVWTTAYDQERPYLDLQDGVRAIAHILRNDMFDGEIYNVLTLNATVRQIVSEIKKFVPAVQVKFVDTQIMNQLSYRVLNDKFKRQGFMPSGDITKCVGDTVNLLAGLLPG
ncbi:NAD-dependent epimerase/dehydratase family protein [Hylemonella gracilis]|uniref:Nucleoside-diphosphate-sugar epimerase n=1 Tax=Hylemonella gracilis ATCC 19624 TaxID=887062 RepID=F3KSD2_9BURK|nr:SDR family oxidoreductase [Hylemonella gracilis]EGI77326.1 nucleoside-diphosphate-sugar epimerase [Hylemonella gracilis ATCC 19624]